ncbi:protein DpdH [Kineococcus radiotolerans]|uniref:protein DpdH n=1 Tax=Kineococcus radiotolerans TaxID=131568 RepID=UPI0012FF2925|nr:protein DpdH [Kineococcus radiotolerans]
MTATDFPGFVCWKRPFVAETVATEAVHADPAVFLATHRPLRVVRTAWEREASGDIVDEQDVLNDFASREPVGGVVLMPILGESGTGKSHLVRWVREHLSETPQRRVVYLPKTGTNLVGLVRALLLDLEGDPFDDIRNRVAKSAGQFDQQRLPHDLLARLAVAVRFHTPQVAETAKVPLAKLLVSERGLPALLNDFEYQRHLLVEGGILDRVAAELQRGRGEGESERPAGFVATDLRPTGVNVKDMGAAAQRIYEQLLGHPLLPQLAADILNANLENAVQALADLGAGQLQSAMVDVRRELHRRGQEILLLIEDFAVIQGVQGDLLDAISETGVREGQQELATVRTLLAVTPGYYKDNVPETFKTRATASVPHSYTLDVSVGRGHSVDHQHVIDFVGRYLNAARLGAQALRTARDNNGTLPNACTSCKFKAPCHDAFGTSNDDFGLYPYNAAALTRAVHLSMPRESARFNPRRILSRVVRHVLDNYDQDVANGAFPSMTFRSDFPTDRQGSLTAEQADYLTRHDALHERRIPLLEFWGGGDAANLNDGIHHAFRLAPLSAEALEALRGRTPDPDPDPDDPDPIRDPAASKARVVDAWHRGELLHQSVANELRQTIREAIVAHVNWGDLGLATPTMPVRRAVLKHPFGLGVIIEGAFGDRTLDPPTTATVVLLRGPANATLFKALLDRKRLGTWNFSGGAEQQRRFTRLLETWGAQMVNAIRAHLGLHQPDTLQAAVDISLIGARLLNLEGNRSANAEALVTCLFDAANVKARPDARLHDDELLRAPSYTTLARQHAATRGDVIAQLREIVGVAQGAGEEQLIDALQLLPLIDKARKALRPTPHADAPEWLGKAHKVLTKGLDRAIQDQWGLAWEVANEVEGHLGDADPNAVLAAVAEAFETAQQAIPGVLSVDSEQLRQELLRARNFPWSASRDHARTMLAAGADPANAADPLRMFLAVSADRGPNAAVMMEFLRDTDKRLDTLAKRAQRDLSTVPESPIDRLQQVLIQAQSAVQEWGVTDA